MSPRLRERLDAFETRANEALPNHAKVGFLTLYVFSTADVDRLDALADRAGWDRWADAAVGALLALIVVAIVAPALPV